MCSRAFSACLGDCARPHQSSSSTVFEDLPDHILTYILSLAYGEQTVSLFCKPYLASDPCCKFEAAVARSIPPCILVSKRVDRLAKQVPINLLHISSGRDNCDDTVRLLESIRWPVRTVAWSRKYREAELSPLCYYVTFCQYPEAVQTVTIAHNSWDEKYMGWAKRCCLREVVEMVHARMPTCCLVFVPNIIESIGKGR